MDADERIAALEAQLAALTGLVENLARAVGALNIDSYIVHTGMHPPGAEPYSSEEAYNLVRHQLDRVRTALEEWT